MMLGARKRELIGAICVAATLLAGQSTRAQTGVGPAPTTPSRSQQWQPADENDPDQTLEIAPRVVAPPAPTYEGEQTQPPSSEPAASQSDDSAPVAAPRGDDSGANANPRRPYLGIDVQYIVSHDTPGRDVHGLEVVSVDANSPAQRAGLHPRGALTELGASGATAGALMAPLDLVVMPLLKKSGQLGAGGDLIVGIDDKRVDAESDLANELDDSKPGDTIYFTIVRTKNDGTNETLKIPVKLGEPVTADTGPPPQTSGPTGASSKPGSAAGKFSVGAGAAAR